jgi:hypothetical protein
LQQTGIKLLRSVSLNEAAKLAVVSSLAYLLVNFIGDL